MPVILRLKGSLPVCGFLPLISLPMAFLMVRMVMKTSGPALNKGLAGTALLALVYCLLLSVGLIFAGK
jgi:1,4-dihydroxy-2-naphthoate octaprenyltransferase